MVSLPQRHLHPDRSVLSFGNRYSGAAPTGVGRTAGGVPELAPATLFHTSGHRRLPVYILHAQNLYGYIMALSIKDPETDRLARALADATGESITEAIRRALEERLSRETLSRQGYRLETAVRRVQERLAKLPVLDARDPDDLLGYDEHGIPR